MVLLVDVTVRCSSEPGSIGLETGHSLGNMILSFAFGCIAPQIVWP